MNIDDVISADDPGDLADALSDLYDQLSELVEEVGLAELDPAVRVAYFVLAANSAMNNDGPVELYDAAAPGSAYVGALHEIGASEMAEILTEALAENDDESIEAWTSYPDDLDSLVVAWVDSHADEFRDA